MLPFRKREIMLQGKGQFIHNLISAHAWNLQFLEDSCPLSPACETSLQNESTHECQDWILALGINSAVITPSSRPLRVERYIYLSGSKYLDTRHALSFVHCLVYWCRIWRPQRLSPMVKPVQCYAALSRQRHLCRLPWQWEGASAEQQLFRGAVWEPV